MKSLQYVFFDFDGTLVDSSEGIVNAINYACEKFGRPKVTMQDAWKFIGPPLYDIFATLWETTDDAVITSGIKTFREYYSQYGVKEACFYEGVIPLLKRLSEAGLKLYIVSSKPVVFIDNIVKRYDIGKYFAGTVGVSLKYRDLSKAERMGSLMREQNITADEVIMVGDRPEDVLAGKANGVKTLGVLYGFGTEQMLTEAGVWQMAKSPQAVGDILLSLRRDF